MVLNSQIYKLDDLIISLDKDLGTLRERLAVVSKETSTSKVGQNTLVEPKGTHTTAVDMSEVSPVRLRLQQLTSKLDYLSAGLNLVIEHLDL